MRRRRPDHDEEHNRERWLISYADFITLLFGFFVVMYSVSSVNEGKYKVLSETLDGIFNAPQRAIQPVPVGERPDLKPTPADEQLLQPITTRPVDANQQEAAQADRPEAGDASAAQLKVLAGQFSTSFASLIEQGLVSINTHDQWIEVSLRNSLLFGSGEAVPHYDAFPVIEALAQLLRVGDNAIRVEGYTDNVPIHTSTFPSNWDLSSARAATMVRLLADAGVAPQRLAAVGYGEFQPIARNDSPEGRRRNRRVVLLISRDDKMRPDLR